MSFSLINMSVTFSHLMNKILQSYLDDIVVFSSSIAEHVSHLHMVFDKLRKHRLVLKHEKCTFGCDEIEFFRSHSWPWYCENGPNKS